MYLKRNKTAKTICCINWQKRLTISIIQINHAYKYESYASDKNFQMPLVKYGVIVLLNEYDCPKALVSRKQSIKCSVSTYT